MNDAQIASQLGAFGVDLVAMSRRLDIALGPILNAGQLGMHVVRLAAPDAVEVLGKKSLAATYRIRGHGHVADRLLRMGRQRGWVAYVFESDVESEPSVDESTPAGLSSYFRRLAVAATMMGNATDRG